MAQRVWRVKYLVSLIRVLRNNQFYQSSWTWSITRSILSLRDTHTHSLMGSQGRNQGSVSMRRKVYIIMSKWARGIKDTSRRIMRMERRVLRGHKQMSKINNNKSKKRMISFIGWIWVRMIRWVRMEWIIRWAVIILAIKETKIKGLEWVKTIMCPAPLSTGSWKSFNIGKTNL